MRLNRSDRFRRAIGIIALMSLSPVVKPESFSTEVPLGIQTARRASPRKPPPRRIRVTRQMTSEAQQRLSDLGYWIGKVDGKWGEASRHALIAFQRSSAANAPEG
jgi:hypothetical protein